MSDTMATPTKSEKGVSKRLYFFTIIAVVVVGFFIGSNQYELYNFIGRTFGASTASELLDTSSLQNTYRQLSANYDGSLDPKKLIEGANKGLVAAAGDPYTVYMTGEETKEFDNDLSGNIGGGIGAEIGVRNGQPTILRVLEGAPAGKAGLMKGDVITKINNTSSEGWTASDAAKEIRGEIGTTVKIVVDRQGQGHEFTITRASVSDPSVRSSIEDGIGILTITRFDGDASSQARKAAEGFKINNVDGVILDLRGNGGGFLDAAEEVAGLWLENKTVVTEKRDGKVVKQHRSGSRAILNGVPTVVLIDHSSASASEIVAGALKDNNAATLIGENTFGKGTIQKFIDLQGGAELKVTIGRWYTPSGRNITEGGIVPDKKVELTRDDFEADRDPQMDAARAFFKTKS